MRIIDRIALLLWRDVDGYDPATGEVSKLHNISLRTKWRRRIERVRKWLRINWKWLVTTAMTAITLGVLLYDHTFPKAHQEVKSNSGKLVFQCVQERNGVLTCSQLEH